MVFSEELALLISADPSQGIGAFTNLASAADKSLSSTESRMQRFSSNVLKLGASGVGIGGVLTQLGSSEQAASQQLDAAIGQVGQSVDDYSSQISDAVSKQEQFGHSAEDTHDAIATLTTAYNDTGAALNRMQLVADLAAREHISLAAAADQVAKAHDGAGRIFKEFGVVVGQNTDGSKNYDGALDLLSQKLSGQASAASDTFMGHLKALGTEVKDQVAVFGESYGPAILGVSTGLTALSGVAQGVGTIIGKVSAAHAASAAAAQADAAAEAEAAAAEAALTVNSSASVASLYAESTAMDAAAGSALGLGAAITGGLAVGLGVVGAFAAVNWSDWFGSNDPDQMQGIHRLVSGIHDLSDADLAGAIDPIKNGLVEYKGDLQTAGIAQEVFNETLKSSPQDAQRVADAYAAMGIPIPDATAQIQDATTALAEADSRSQAFTGSLKDQKKATEEETTAIQGYTGLINDLAGAMEKTYQGTVSQTKLHETFESSLDSVTKAIQTNGATLDDSTEKGRANIDAVLAQGDAIAKLAESRFQETHNTQDAQNVASLYTQALDNQLTNLGLNTQQVHAMNAEMGLTPEQIATTFSSNAVEQQIVVGKYLDQLHDVSGPERAEIETDIEQGHLDAANAILNELAAPRQVLLEPFLQPGVVVSGADGMLHIKGSLGIGFNAAGTDDWRGGPTWINEKGPEIVDLPNGTRIIPHDVSMAMARNSAAPASTAPASGGISIGQVNITEATSARETAGQLAIRLRREAMLAGV